MSFLHPLGLLGLIGIPILILIYIIKPKFQEKLVSSTFIWKLSLKYQKKSVPLQWLNNSLLFLVQALIITVISLLLAGPVIESKDGAAEKIVILDASASMLVEGDNGTYFESAVAQIEELADAMVSHGKMTIICAAQEAGYLLKQSDSEREVKETLKQAVCGYGEADIVGAFALAEEILLENPEAQVYLFTDKEYEAQENIQIVDVSETGDWNVAVLSLTEEKHEEKKLVFTAELASYGKSCDVTTALYVDGVLSDAQIVSLTDSEVTTVSFVREEAQEYQTAQIYLEAKDAIALDNEFYLFAEKETKYEVLLVGEQSVFLETVLGRFDELKVTAVASLEELDLEPEVTEDGAMTESIPSTGYDLYVYDGQMPEQMPKDGAVWLICPEEVPEGALFTVEKAVTADAYMQKAPNSGTETFTTLSAFLDAENVYINEYTRVSNYESYESIFLCNGDPVILAGTVDYVKTVLILFDLHNSNMTVQIEFPELIYNMVHYSLSETLEHTLFEVGDPVMLEGISGAVITTVTGADGKAKSYLSMPAEYVPVQPGKHSVLQVFADGEGKASEFYVRLSEEESDVVSPGGVLPVLSVPEEEISYVRGISEWLFLALLVLILIEWGLQYREQF